MADNILKAQKQLEKLNKVFDQHTSAMSKSLDVLEKINAEYAIVPSEFIKNQKEITRLEAAQARTRITLQREIQTAEKEASAARIRANRERISGIRVQETEARQIRRINTEREKERKLLAQNNNFYTKISKTVARLTNEYNDLAARKKILNNLSSKEEKRLKSLTKNINKYQTGLKSVDAEIQKHGRNVGNYGNKLNSLKGVLTGLVGAFGLVEGIRFGASLIKDSIEVARAAKGIEFTFDRLGLEGEKAFTKIKEATKGLISDIDIKAAVNDFDNFNLKISDLSTILEFVSVRASQTGKSFDQLRQSALEAITKESVLRADNLGLSQKELNDKMDEGSTFMEAFGEIAKREISEAGNLLDEGANASQRFNAAADNLSLTFGKIFTSFKGSDVIVNFLEGMNTLLKSSKELSDDFNSSLRATASDAFLSELKGQAIDTGKTLEETARDSFFKYRSGVDATKMSIISLRAELKAVESQEVKGRGAYQEKTKAIEALNEKLKEEEKSLIIKEARLDKINSIIKENTKEESEKKGTIESYEREIEAQKDFIKTTATTREEVEAAQIIIENLQKKINELKGVVVRVKIQTVDTHRDISSTSDERERRDGEAEGFDAAFDDSLEGFGIQAPKTDEINSALQDIIDKYGEVAEASKISFNKQKEIFSDLFNTFGQIYNIDLNAFTELLAGKAASFDDWAGAISAVSNIVFEAKQAGYDRDLEANQLRLEGILNDDAASEEQKAIAQKKADQKEKEIKTKKAKADRQNALIQIGIDTALAVVKALASSPPPANFVMAGIVGALGLAQLAVVASQPLPQFADGTQDAPEGLALTQERGAEPITDKHGNIKTFGSRGGAKLTYLNKGDKVYKNMSEFVNSQAGKESLLKSATTDNEMLQNSDNMIMLDYAFAMMKDDVIKGTKEGVKQGLKGFKNITNIHMDSGHGAWKASKGY